MSVNDFFNWQSEREVPKRATAAPPLPKPPDPAPSVPGRIGVEEHRTPRGEEHDPMSTTIVKAFRRMWFDKRS